jgi:hypothetical protein
MFATRTKNEQSASSNAVNFIVPIPAYAGMTKRAYARRDKEKKPSSYPRRWVSIALQEKKEKLSATHWIPTFVGMTVKWVLWLRKIKKHNNLTVDVCM